MGDYGGDYYIPRHRLEADVISAPLDPSFSLWLAVSVLGAIASGRHLLQAERRGNRLSVWMSALAFVPFSLSAALDLAELLQGLA